MRARSLTCTRIRRGVHMHFARVLLECPVPTTPGEATHRTVGPFGARAETRTLLRSPHPFDPPPPPCPRRRHARRTRTRSRTLSHWHSHSPSLCCSLISLPVFPMTLALALALTLRPTLPQKVNQSCSVVPALLLRPPYATSRAPPALGLRCCGRGRVGVALPQVAIGRLCCLA